MIFADECVFKARGYQKNAWSNQKTNIIIEDRTGNSHVKQFVPLFASVTDLSISK